MRKSLYPAVTGLALLTALTLGAAPASASRPAPPPRAGTPVTLASGLVLPLSLASGPHSSLVVSQNGAGTLTNIDARGKLTSLYQTSTPGAEIGAVSSRWGATYFSENTGAGPDPAPNTGVLKVRWSNGTVHTITDVAKYEAQRNPDRNVTYGFRDLKPWCLKQVPAAVPASYKGEVDSHPYATEPGRTELFVADAGGNDILAVNLHNSRIRTVAVLPPSVTVVTKAMAAGQGLPNCTIGHKYYFEPVPTDVRQGKDGWLYVTSLPGGPEGTALGARGALYKVNPWTGAVRLVTAGLASPTGVAISDRGDIYIAELFGGRISVLRHDHRGLATFLNVGLPGDVMIRDGYLYATTNVLPADNTAPNGQVIKVRLAGWHHGDGDHDDDD